MERNFEKPKDIKQVSDVIWEIPTSYKKGMNVPARIYATKKLLDGMDAMDGDTLNDFEEVKNLKTNPLNKNTDGDRYNDDKDKEPYLRILLNWNYHQKK